MSRVNWRTSVSPSTLMPVLSLKIDGRVRLDLDLGHVDPIDENEVWIALVDEKHGLAREEIIEAFKEYRVLKTKMLPTN